MSRPNLIFALVIVLSMGAFVGLLRHERPAPRPEAPARPPRELATRLSATPPAAGPPIEAPEAPEPTPHAAPAAVISPAIIAAVPPSVAEPSLSREMIARTAFRREGNATLDAALKTHFWSATTTDTETLASLFMWDSEESRAKFASTLPSFYSRGSVPHLFGSMEKLIATLHATDALALTGVQVTAQETVDPDVQRVGLLFTYANGTTREDNFVMRRTETGWRRDLSGTTFVDLARRLDGRAVNGPINRSNSPGLYNTYRGATPPR